MRRREFITTGLAVIAAARPFNVEARTLPRLGFLNSASPDAFRAYLAAFHQGLGDEGTRLGVLWPVSDSPELDAFRDGLRDLGYIEGQNVTIEYRFAKGNDALLPDLAADLVRQDVDVIVTWGVTAARVALQATTTIPIVNGSMSDPVRAKLVDSLSRPGGNLTGLTSSTPELSAKRLELMRETVLGLSRVAVLSTGNPTAVLGLKETEEAARALGLTLHLQQVDEIAGLEHAFTSMAEAGAEGLVVLADLLFNQHRDRLVGLAAGHRLPTVYYAREFVEAGGLMSYAPSFRNQFRQAATYVDKILTGADPADLPIERASRFDLVINVKAADALGIELPHSLLARADEVIE